MDLSSINTSNLSRAPSGYSGVDKYINLSMDQGIICNINKIVLGPNGDFDLHKTIARTIWIKAGSPTDQVTAEAGDITGSISKVGQHMIKHSLYSLLNRFGVELDLRLCDTVSSADWDVNPLASVYEEASKVLWTWIHQNPEKLEAACRDAGGYMLVLIYNGLHRAEFSGVNVHLSDYNTDCSASSNLREFANSMRGLLDRCAMSCMAVNDMWHDLTDRGMSIVCNAITGYQPVSILGPVYYAGRVFGENGSKVWLHDVLDLPACVLDRWPPNGVGYNSLKAALGLVAEMTSIIEDRMSVAKVALDSPTDCDGHRGDQDSNQELVLDYDGKALELWDMSDLIDKVTGILTIKRRKGASSPDTRDSLVPVIAFASGFIQEYEGNHGVSNEKCAPVYYGHNSEIVARNSRKMGSSIGHYIAHADPRCPMVRSLVKSIIGDLMIHIDEVSSDMPQVDATPSRFESQPNRGIVIDDCQVSLEALIKGIGTKGPASKTMSASSDTVIGFSNYLMESVRSSIACSIVGDGGSGVKDGANEDHQAGMAEDILPASSSGQVESFSNAIAGSEDSPATDDLHDAEYHYSDDDTELALAAAEKKEPNFGLIED